MRRKDGAAAGKEDRKGGRLCEEFKTRDKDRNGHSRLREANGPKNRGADGKGKVGAKGANKGGGVKSNPMACHQEVYLTAMVVPRTPVAPRTQDKTQNQGEVYQQPVLETGPPVAPSACRNTVHVVVPGSGGPCCSLPFSPHLVSSGQNHDRPPDNVAALSRSSSEGGSNRMSLSSDTEGPPPGPPHSCVPHPLNPDITEEEAEGDPTPCTNLQTDPAHRPGDDDETEMDSSKSEVDAGGRDGTDLVDGPTADRQVGAGQMGPKSQSAAGLCYDAVKYTLVVDEHARLELVSLKDCFHGYNNKHNDDSDTETVYQSANEEEDPEYEEERRKEEEKKEGKKL